MFQLDRRRGGYPKGWCRWHQTPTPKLEARCSYCRTRVHTHRDRLAEAKRQGEGFVVERCPACHRPNALRELYGGGDRVGALAMENDALVVQGRLKGVGER